MKWFANLKMAAKLKLGFGLCLAFAVVSCFVAVGRLGQLNAGTKNIVDDPFVGVVAIGKISSHVRMIRMLEFRNSIPGSQSKAAEIKEVYDKSLAEIKSGLEKYEIGALIPEDKAKSAKLKQLWEDYEGGYAEVVALATASKFQETQKLVMQRKEKFYALCEHMDLMAEWNSKRGDTLAGEAATIYQSGRNTMIGLLVLSALAVFGIGITIIRSITSPVAQILSRLQSLEGICVSNLHKAMDAMAQGDLTSKVVTGTKLLEIDTKDELGEIAQTLNAVVGQMQGTIESFHNAQTELSQILARTRLSADSILIASSEVAAGNDDLAQRTEEQAASLEETASSMQEMTESVRQNADNAKQANQMATQARSIAEKGGNVVSQAVKAMGEIDATSKQVVDIITVIDEIAFQTNLLALNAAVEAARVGEQGKGFAVVAAEVRSLAARSATAAKEIKALVQDSVAKVEEGCLLVNQSGETLEEIVNSVKKVADIVAEISAASQEQSTGIDEVSKAINQMDQITQQNAALVEEASAASTSMRDQSQSLQEDVSRFEIAASYLSAARQGAGVPSVERQPMRATGTDGKPSKWTSSSNKSSKRAAKSPLVMSKGSSNSVPIDDFEAGFEEF